MKIQCPFTIRDFGFFKSTQIHPLNKRTEERVLKGWEIEIMTKTTGGECVLNGKSIPQQMGRVFIAAPGDRRYSIVRDIAFQCYYIHIRDLDDELEARLHALPATFFVKDVEPYFTAFREILRKNTEAYADSIEILSGIAEIVAHLIEEKPIPDDVQYQSFLVHREGLKKTKEYMDAHYAEDIRVESLGSMANLSPSYYHKLFTETFGISPGKYLQNLRLSYGKMLLITTTLSILEVSERSGFSSQHYFTARFKAAYQLSPLQYRRMMQQRKIE